MGCTALVCLTALGCGGSTDTAASKCPAGQTTISGRFHGTPCVARATARVSAACEEAQYELEVVVDHEFQDPQVDVIRSELERGAGEAAAILAKAAEALAATHEEDRSQSHWVARHRGWLLAYGRRLHRARGSLAAWLRPLISHELACEPHASIPLRAEPIAG